MPRVDRRRLSHSQNFLRSPRLAERLIARSGIGPDDLVVEIGSGRGMITERLAPVCRQVLAIEQDPLLAEDLRRRLTAVSNVALFAGDALAFQLPVSPYKVFANIPFDATAAIVAQVTTEPSAASDAFLVVQREAAERFIGAPRGTLAAALLWPWFEASVVHRFRRGDFLPAPRVDVVMLRLKKRGPPFIASEQAGRFRDLVAWIYTAWQPTVHDALAAALGPGPARVIERRVQGDLGRPPTALAGEDWLALFGAAQVREQARLWSVAVGAFDRLRAHRATLTKRHRTRASRGRTGRPSL